MSNLLKLSLAILLLTMFTAGCAKKPGVESTPTAPGAAHSATSTRTVTSQKSPQKTLPATRTIRPTRTLRPTRTPPPTRTATATPTATATSTQTEIPRPRLNVFIRTCDTGFDLAHGMGEVTNAYLTIQNLGSLESQNLEVMLSASDEDRLHPDKSYTVQHLPPGHEIALKLTVDTKSNTNTSISVLVADPAFIINETAVREDCSAILPDTVMIGSLEPLFVVRPVK